MNEQQTPTPTAAERRDNQVAAKRRVEEIAAEQDRNARSIGTTEAEMRALASLQGRSAEKGHKHVEALRDAAEGRLQAEIHAYLGELETVVAEAPDPPPPSLVAAFVAARAGDSLYLALHAAVDAAVEDGSTAAFPVATEAELAEQIADKRSRIAAARTRAGELDVQMTEASDALLRAQTEGR